MFDVAIVKILSTSICILLLSFFLSVVLQFFLPKNFSVLTIKSLRKRQIYRSVIRLIFLAFRLTMLGLCGVAIYLMFVWRGSIELTHDLSLQLIILAQYIKSISIGVSVGYLLISFLDTLFLRIK